MKTPVLVARFQIPESIKENIGLIKLIQLEADLSTLNYAEKDCRPDNSEEIFHPHKPYVPANAIILRQMLKNGTPITNRAFDLTNKYIQDCWGTLVDNAAKKETEAKNQVKADAQLKALVK